MSYRSGLLGAAITLMGAVSLNTPEVMQIHEVGEQSVLLGEAKNHVHAELLRISVEDAHDICLNNNQQTGSKQGESGRSALIQVAFRH
ncbi:hypothetical protein [Synechococcus sp. BIOS-U3-1]|uniref:hypothetical protein n=1 Tax=Synechococcus sp. BIOS-U3-1 TaxID=1400865 RepID=UPI00164855C6|nr:hypothetical protein [Synechococcus sp. BIOS-U3-1]|tara:strand:- start:1147 stop:1410 length:264 start_codon:yes stop_codon:yes gene_type:complete